MKVTGLHVFLILLATIVFCSCLGKEKKTVIEGATGSMAAHKHHRRNDVKRREEQSRKREITNYRKKEHVNKQREYEERLRRLERKERENRERRRKMIEMEKRRREEHYDDHDKLHDRMMNEQYDERPGGFHVDDHRMKRRTRNRAKMEPNNRHPHDDKYMLKSEMVPPVCPTCPHGGAGGPGGPGGGNGAGGNNGDRPCPPCARCPEPSFDCKKVPNYNSRTPGGEGGLPKPLLTDFSTFGA